MNEESEFIKTVAQEYIEKTHPEEGEFLSAYLQYAEQHDFAPNLDDSQDIPFGFGGSDLLDMFQSPVVIQVLIGIWKELVSPVAVEILKKRLVPQEKNDLDEQLLKALPPDKLRDYIRKRVKKQNTRLSDKDVDNLADGIVNYLRRSLKRKK